MAIDRMAVRCGFARARGVFGGKDLPVVSKSESASVVIATRVPATTAAQLRSIAARFDVPVSDVVDWAIDRYLLCDVDDEGERAA